MSEQAIWMLRAVRFSHRLGTGSEVGMYTVMPHGMVCILYTVVRLSATYRSLRCLGRYSLDSSEAETW